MKEVVVISGKGGTGKTSITSAFAHLLADRAIFADCDVDAADLHILLNPEHQHKQDFYSGEIAKIDTEKCSACGKCMDVCRFDAVDLRNGEYSINELSCEGCGYCSKVCPENAIENLSQKQGEWYISNTRLNNTLVHAKLNIGADNSGKLVAKVKSVAKDEARKQKKEFVIVDGSPGVGCPVVSSLSGADFVVFVTEASNSALHDLKRVYELVSKFNIPSACIINKADINVEVSSRIKRFLKENNTNLLAEINYNPLFSKAITNLQTISEYNKEISKTLKEVWGKIELKI